MSRPRSCRSSAGSSTVLTWSPMGASHKVAQVASQERHATIAGYSIWPTSTGPSTASMRGAAAVCGPGTGRGLRRSSMSMTWPMP